MSREYWEDIAATGDKPVPDEDMVATIAISEWLDLKLRLAAAEAVCDATDRYLHDPDRSRRHGNDAKLHAALIAWRRVSGRQP